LFLLYVPSFRRRREGGVKFEVQHQFGEDFGRGLEVKAFAWRVIEKAGASHEIARFERFEIGLSWQEPAEAADGVFNAAFLPRSVSIAEKGLELEGGVEDMMQSELGAVAPTEWES
jgi:hypothetical protein